VKKAAKSSVSLFRLLIQHSERDYEPSPSHILKRMLKPLCRNLAKIVEGGTKNDAWNVIEGFLRECEKAKGK
jgi:hypothetical protein